MPVPQGTGPRARTTYPLSADPDAVYDEEYTIDLSALEPLAAMSAHARITSRRYREIGEIKVDQVLHRLVHQLLSAMI